MSNVKEARGGGTSITITLNSLASSTTAGRESTAIDNSTNLYLDALVVVTLVTATGTIGSTPYAFVYALGSVDAGTTWPDPATGSDAGITVGNQIKAGMIGAVNLAAASTSYKSQPMSVAAAFAGILPSKWSIVVLNSCGVGLSSSGCSAQYDGQFATVT